MPIITMLSKLISDFIEISALTASLIIIRTHQHWNFSVQIWSFTLKNTILD